MIKYKKHMSAVWFLVFAFGFLSQPAQAENYAVDMAHAQIGFTVKHLMMTDVHGQFKTFEGVVDYNKDDVSKSNFAMTVLVDSIDTGVEKRDEHLKTGDFFKVDEFPNIRFESTSVRGTPDHLTVAGNLTMRGVTKPVTFDAKVMGPVSHPMGGEVISISGETTINRQDFGVSWNKTLDQGGVMVGDDVKINISLEAKKLTE